MSTSSNERYTICDLQTALDELAQLDQWVISKLVDGQKPPFSPHTRRKCSHSNPADWASYQQARDALPGFSWLGFVFSEYDPYSGIDLDGCRNPETGAIEPWAQRIIDMCDSYTEVSPSGAGVKIWVRGTLPESLKKSFGPHIGIEVYSKQRYFTLTGSHLPGTPQEIRDAQVALELLWTEYKPAPKAETPATIRPIEKSSPGERAVARDVIARLNAANDLGSLLESKGATLVRTAGDARHYSGLAGDAHSHAITYIVSPAKGGNGHIGYSYSPNGKLNNVDFARGFSWFDAICALDYSGVVIDALKALNPIQPRRRRQEPPIAEPEYRTKDQDADAERKRAARRQAAADVRADVRARADQDDTLWPADRAVLAALLSIAGDRDWCRPSKERLVQESGYSLGAVKRSLMKLHRLKYFTSQGDGSPAGRNQTAIRTFLCGSYFDTETVFDAKNDPQIDLASNDLDQTLGACEPPPAPPAESVYPATQPPERAALVDQLSAMDDAEFAAWFAGHGAPEPEPEYAASYTPVDLPDAFYTGKSKRHLDLETRMQLVRDSMQPRETPHADTPDAADMFDPEPEVLSPPIEPHASARYWSLRGKAQKPTTSVEQRRKLNALADALMVYMPASDAVGELRARSPARARRAPTVAQEVLYGIP